MKYSLNTQYNFRTDNTSPRMMLVTALMFMSSVMALFLNGKDDKQATNFRPFGSRVFGQ